MEKPRALALAASAEIEITRDLADYSFLSVTDATRARGGSHLAQLISAVQPPRNEKLPCRVVAIAFGSNLGDRFANIEFAMRLLESPGEFLDAGDDINQKDAEIAIIDTSFLYESAPMYVTDQPSFVNGACLVRASIHSVMNDGCSPRYCFRSRRICHRSHSSMYSKGLKLTSGGSHRSGMDHEPSTWISCFTRTRSLIPGHQSCGFVLKISTISWSSLIRGSRRESLC